MLGVVKRIKKLEGSGVEEIWDNEGEEVLGYMGKELIFVLKLKAKECFSD